MRLTIPQHQLTLSGNTSGVLAPLSSGTLTLAGGNAITLSQNGNAVTIVGPSLSESQTFIAGISASDTVYTSGTVRFTGVGGGITVSSNTGQRVDLSVAAQSIQTQNVVDVTLSGNTAGALALVSSGTMTLAGGNNITLSQAGNAVTISGANAGGAQTGISGIANSQTTYTSGTVSLSELGAITIRSTTGNQFQLSVPATSSLSATGAVSVSTNGSTISIGVPLSVAGVGNSETTYSSGTVNLSALGALTIRSTTGQAFQLSVNAQSVQPETQTFIGGISASDTLYTSGTVRLTGVGGGVTVSSNTGQRVDISVAAQSVQPETQTFVGGISASDTLYTSGTVRLTGVGGGITVSTNTGQRIDLSVAAQSVQPETQTFIAGIQNSETTYTSGTVNLSVVAGQLTIRSTTGNAFQFSASQSVQAETQTAISGIGNSQTTYTSGTVNLSVNGGALTIRSTTGNAFQFSVSQSVQAETQTFVGGIQNSETTYTSGTVNLSVVGGPLTIRSTTGNAFQFSAATQTVQAETQTFIGGIRNSETTYTSGTVRLSELGAVTIRSTTGNAYQISVNAQSVQAETQTFIGGLQNSETTYTSGTVNLSVNGGALTIRSTTGNAFQFSVSQSVQAETQTFVAGIRNSETTYTSGTVNLSVNGGNMTIRSTTGNAFQFSISQSVQAETQTFVGGIANSETTYTSGTVSLSVVAGNLTIRSTTGNAYQFSVSESIQTQGILSAGISTGGNTSGTSTVNTGSRLVFVGSNNITLSQGTAAGASTITISGPSAQTGISAISNSNTTYTSGTIGLSELGAITIRSTTGNQFQFSVNSQTVQTQNFVALSATNTLYTSGTVLLTGSNMITVKSSGAGQTIILDATQSVQTQGILNVALSNIGNTSGDTGLNSGTRMVLAGGNNITLSASTAAGATTITISAPNLGAGAMSLGVSTGGNTAGATGITGTRLVLVGTNNISLSQTTDANGGTISINNTVSAFLGGMSTDGNTAGNTGVTGTRLVFVGSGPVSLSQTTGAAGATLSINAPATSSLSATGYVSISTNGSTISIGVPKVTLADWQNIGDAEAALMTHVSAISKTPFYWNDEIPGAITAKSLGIKVSLVTASQPMSVSVHLGVYTFVNSTSANLLGSHSEAYVVSSASSVSLSGVRNLAMTGIGTHATLSALSEGEYMFGMMFSATATNAMNFSLYGGGSLGTVLGNILPGTNALSTGTSQGLRPMYGRQSVTLNAMPANIVASDLANQGSSPLRPWIYIRS